MGLNTIAGVAGLAAGTTLSTLSAVQAMRQRQQQTQAANEFQRQQSEQVKALTEQAAAFRLQQQSAFQQQQAQINSQLSKFAASAKKTLGNPVRNAGKLHGLDTIYTSPLGDTSTPNVGKRRLLGNY